jgi:hypothetical protein
VKGTFGARVDELKEKVGRGKLTGSVEVDQVYAQYQHEGYDLHHPDGGKPSYLRDPLFEKSDKRMQKLADNLITEEGSNIKDAMADAMEDLSNDVYEQAPWEFGDLRASGHPMVKDDDETIYDRAPRVHRLSEDELREKSRTSRIFWPDRYKR